MSKDLQKTGGVNAPAHLQQYKGVGQEDITSDILKLPFIKVVQKMSAEMDDGVSKYGDVLNSITKEKITDEKGEVDIIVIKHFIAYKIFGENGLEDYSTDGVNWSSGNTYPQDEIWKYRHYEFFVILADEKNASPLPYQLSFGKNKHNIKASQDLLNIVAQKCTSKGLPIFAKPFTLSAKEVKNNANKAFMAWSIKPSTTEWTSDILSKKAAELRKFIDSKRQEATTTKF